MCEDSGRQTYETDSKTDYEGETKDCSEILLASYKTQFLFSLFQLSCYRPFIPMILQHRLVYSFIELTTKYLTLRLSYQKESYRTQSLKRTGLYSKRTLLKRTLLRVGLFSSPGHEDCYFSQGFSSLDDPWLMLPSPCPIQATLPYSGPCCLISAPARTCFCCLVLGIECSGSDAKVRPLHEE